VSGALSQRRPDVAVGLVKFYSQAEITKYLRELAEFYQKEAEKYGDKLGSMLRPVAGDSAPREEKKQEKGDKGDKKGDPKARASAGGWVKMGSLIINMANAGPATTEVMYQIHEDLKAKLARTNEALKSFETNANQVIPQVGTFHLYVRNGVPERIIVEAEEVRKAAFNFDGKFRVV